MSLSFDPSSDFVRATDGLEPVTLLRRGASATALGTVIAHALRRVATTHEAAPSDGRATASDVTWHLSVAELPEPPRLGDVLRDARGVRWVVLEVVQATLGSRWQCTSRSLALAHGLNDTISILQAAYPKGAAGAMDPVWQPWRTGIWARIQPLAAETGLAEASRQTLARYLVFVEEPLELDHRHRIREPDGTLYRVLRTTRAERIGELPSIEVEVVP
jgi:hypothetical protein